MNQKKSLLILVSTTLLIGVVFSMVPFFSSLQPNAKAEAALFKLDISKINNGEFIIFDHPNYGDSIRGYKWSVMIYKSHSGSITAFDIPRKGKATGLPDMYWWRPAWPCFNFGPTFSGSKVDESMPIKCHDNREELDYWLPQVEWDLSGKTIKGGMDNMLPTLGTVEGKHFVFGKRS
ncbi:hypothetical protein [Microbulbifer sp. THAF38]|uniref:hypothetical protein n=2 Tax=unclassified Microbulbifer TaxID=2619833 RepID=UPI0012678B47|nr:hypothetical protein [Microbulbifer sp. THAF38]